MYLSRLSLVLLLIITTPLLGGEIGSAISAYEQGDFKTAKQKLTILAQDNNPTAQYNLAFMYFNGDGVTQSDIEAVYWFQQAAMSGHAQAQDTLAYMYLHGRGLKADRVMAYTWYSLAADNGVFLARNVSNRLKNQLDTSELTHAQQLLKELGKRIKKIRVNY